VPDARSEGDAVEAIDPDEWNAERDRAARRRAQRQRARHERRSRRRSAHRLIDTRCGRVLVVAVGALALGMTGTSW